MHNATFDGVLAVNTDDDAAVAVLKDGVIHFLELDRLMRVKHFGLNSAHGKWPNMPILDKAYPTRWKNAVVRTLRAAQEFLGVEISTICDTSVVDSPNCAYTPSTVEAFIQRLLGRQVEFAGYDHPTSHAEEVVFTNGLREGSVVSLDAVGDGCGAVFDVHNGLLKERARRHVDSFGVLYDVLTSFFVGNRGDAKGLEGTFMAYAGLGHRVNVDEQWRRLRRLTAPTLTLTDAQWTACFSVLEDAVREHGAPNAAHECQQRWVEEVLAYIHGTCPPGRPLLFTGGCALNCLVNHRLICSKQFPRVGWSPTPGDSGQPIGILLQRARAVGMDPSGWRIETPDVFDNGWWIGSAGHLGAQSVTTEELAGRLASGQAVGVCRGSVERGPRALGRRSILASPLTKGMQARLNALKGRQAFRPFGVVVPVEHLRDFTDLQFEAPWMNVVIDPPKGLMPEAEHVDGSTRVQTLRATDDPWLHELVTAFGQITGVYAVINTSLNGPGQPIINHAADAVALLARGLDAVVVDDVIINK